MNTILLYLFESTICLSVLYPVYWFFLRRDTFFQVNRFYLLAMVLFSILVPLLPLHWIPSGTSAAFVVLLDPVLITSAKVEHTLSVHLQWIEVATVVYLTGALIFLLRFGLQLIQLYRITRRFGIKESHGQRVVFVDRGYSPFSFFNLVFINEEVIPAGSLPTILEHERVHIRQHHTLDMILVELAAILQWFNPVIWLAGREMKTIHEYLADEGVLQTGISRSQYQQMILDETMGIQVNSLTNNFNVSLLKKRILMMTKSKSGILAKSKVLIALPALTALLFLLPSFTINSSSNNGSSDKTQVTLAFITADAAVPITASMEPQDKEKKKTEAKYIPGQPDKNGVYPVVEQQPEYTGGDEARIKFMVENIKYPEEAKKAGIQGKVFVTFVIQADGAVTDVKVLRGIGGGCDEEAVRVVKMMPNWIPGKEQGKNVAVQFNLPIKFRLDSGKKDKPKK
ncbi:MAG TPA: M56 family metallopeptidase [Bacteroidales bacterium]|nr:M56 family metallopeptidase [Bacteroidales bacterium]